MKLCDLLNILNDNQGLDLCIDGEKYPSTVKTAKRAFSDEIRHMYVDKIEIDNRSFGALLITLK